MDLPLRASSALNKGKSFLGFAGSLSKLDRQRQALIDRRNKMKMSLCIIITLVTSVAYAQYDLPQLGKEILTADSIIIYASPKNFLLDMSDSSCCNMISYNDSFKIRVRISAKAKTELATTFIKPNDFVGRFASRSGFSPTEIIALWKNGKLQYAKVSRITHDIYFSRGSSWISLNPFDVDSLEKFYKRNKITDN